MKYVKFCVSADIQERCNTVRRRRPIISPSEITASCNVLIQNHRDRLAELGATRNKCGRSGDTSSFQWLEFYERSKLFLLHGKPALRRLKPGFACVGWAVSALQGCLRRLVLDFSELISRFSVILWTCLLVSLQVKFFLRWARLIVNFYR